MSGSSDSSMRALNDCGCCVGVRAETPQSAANLPGQSAIAYRAGQFSQFKASMLARLSTADTPRNLRTRDDDDFSIALLDAWASLLDVLTFYQERIANECFMRTATERRSILELARLIGYELRPGVSATADLAFTLEESAAAPDLVPMETGTKVQSIPGPNEKPQTFETAERIVARRAWNAMKPRQVRRHVITALENPLRFDGTATNLRAGDALLITPDESGAATVFRQVATVTLRAADKLTEVTLQPPPAGPSALHRVIGPVAFNPGRIVRELLTLGHFYAAADLRARGEVIGFQPREVFSNLAATQPPPPSVLAFRTRAAVFGNNAPTYAALTKDVRGAFDRWVDALDSDGQAVGPVAVNQNSESADTIYLDNVYPSIIPNSYIVLKDGGTTRLFQVQDATEITKSDFTLSLKVTRLTLTLRSPDELAVFSIRGTTVFAQSEDLSLAPDPIPDPVTGTTIELDGYVDGLSAGQRIIFSGESSDDVGVQLTETATIDAVTHNIDADGSTSITVVNQLLNSYVRTGLVIYGNVARATHGESTTELLGSGDATQTYQSFSLKQPPLTYVSSPAAPGGAVSTLQIFVNNAQWNEVPTLYGIGPTEHVFVTRTGDDGSTTVQFGDGLNGARLPSGEQNVQAAYRKGIGLCGMVAAGQLSLLLNRPLGVRGASNPHAAQGAEDRESLGARANASLTIMTLDRIVSVEDYENFARAFAGIAKARAHLTWSGEATGVFVTLAGPDGAEVEPDGPTYTNLFAAMRRFGDPHVPLSLASYRKALFQISARLVLAPNYAALAQLVLDTAEGMLRQAFSFTARSFGQTVALSEVVAILQGVDGVQAVEVSALFRSGDEPVLNALLPASAPQSGPNLVGAELLTLDPRTVDLGIA